MNDPHPRDLWTAPPSEKLTMQSHLFLFATLIVAVCTHSLAADPELPDGFYTGRNTPVKLEVTAAHLWSVNNFNSQYRLSVTTEFDEREYSGLWLNLGGTQVRCFSSGGSGNESRSFGFGPFDALAAKSAAALLGIQPQLREHPGYRLAVRFQTDKAEYAEGDTVEATLVIKNVGKVPLTFMDGARNRGTRNNQFSFTCRRDGDAVLDTGDAGHHGGLAAGKTLRPGDVFSKSVDLGKWFRLEKGHYQVLGSYYFEVVDKQKQSPKTVWTDYATGEFYFQVK